VITLVLVGKGCRPQPPQRDEVPEDIDEIAFSTGKCPLANEAGPYPNLVDAGLGGFHKRPADGCCIDRNGGLRR
jgi:hypothetical protein